MKELSPTQTIAQTLRDRAHNTKPGERFDIITLPKDLVDNANTETIRARVIQRENDGTVRLRTDHGTITAKAEQPSTLQNGDTVTLRIQYYDNAQPSATIKPALPHNDTAPTTHNQPIDVQNNQIRPQSIPAQNLNKIDTIPVTPFPSQHIENIALPYLTEIETALPLHHHASIINFVTESALLSTQATLLSTSLSHHNPPQTHIAFAPEPLIHHTELSANFTLKHIQSDHIFSTIMTPQGDDVITQTSPPELFGVAPIIQSISIDTITPPTPITNHGETYRPHGITAENTVKAEFVGFTPDKHFPVLKIHTPHISEDRHYALQHPVSDLTLSSTLHISRVEHAVPSPIAPNIPVISPLAALPAFTSSDIWPTLQEIQTTLIQANPQAAQNFTASIPNSATPNTLGGTALFFLAAMRSGDIQNWLGDKTIETLRQAGKGELLTRLGTELSGLARLANDPVSQDWRMLSLPFAHQNEIHKIVMHYRKEERQSNAHTQNTGAHTRFVMDLNLSNMGKIQLDALFTAQTQNIGRLDLVLRTEHSFSAAMKQHMRENYKNALDTTHITGELLFQNNPNQWVVIIPDKTTEFTRDV